MNSETKTTLVDKAYRYQRCSTGAVTGHLLPWSSRVLVPRRTAKG